MLCLTLHLIVTSSISILLLKWSSFSHWPSFEKSLFDEGLCTAFVYYIIIKHVRYALLNNPLPNGD